MKKTFTVLLLTIAAGPLLADEFTEQEVDRWQQHYEDVADQGRSLWTDPALGTNGVACAQCHPNAANTHPETYPKFQKQLGRVAELWEMINWCIRNPLEGEDLAADDPKMIALQAYVARERRGVPLAPGKH
jgi:thiosulfate dehydrogenase